MSMPQLVEPLGKGGNGEVWEARNSGGQIAAVKIIMRPGKGNERFHRFENEVTILRRLGNYRGILPLLDYNVPSHPGSGLAWLAMPKATPSRDQIGTKPNELTPVVEAIAAIAQTLARLHKEYEVTHRDLKPENLYYWDGQWVLGDFGLVRFPEAAKLTSTGKHVGSFNYLAPELRTSHFETVDYSLSDVYALAKTLWVLATGYPDPPFGQHRTDRPLYTISKYFPDSFRTNQLDILLQAATDDDPTRRPTMSEFGRELTSWLQPSVPSTGPADLSDLVRTFKDLTTYENPQDVRKERFQRFSRDMHEQLTEVLRPLALTIQGSIGNAPGLPLINLSTPLFMEPSLHYLLPRQLPDDEYPQSGVYTTVRSPDPTSVTLFSGFACQALDRDRVYILAAHLILSRPGHEVVWAACAVYTPNLVQEKAVLGQLGRGLQESLRDAVGRFLEVLAAMRSVRLP